jgi:hypothetical protein
MAVTSDGDVLLNLAMFDIPKTVEAPVAAGVHEPGQLFVAVVVPRTEVSRVRAHLHHAQREVAAWIVGARQRRRRRKKQVAPMNGSASYFFG